MLHLPILRAGRPYRSLDVNEMRSVVTGDPVARVSQANRGLIARDLDACAEHRRKLEAIPIRELFDVCRRAADLYATAELPVDPIDGVMQGPEDYVVQLSATTGMPRALCRIYMERIRFVLSEVERVVAGLTRGLDPEVFDRGWTERDGRTVAFRNEADALGAILPSNSPGVHSLWLPAIPMKVPLVLKPGREEPWSPFRIGQALIAAGCPPEAISFYPTDHGGSTEVLLRCQRSMLFGDVSTVGSWAGDTRVQLHGPGWSKVVLGDDEAPQWRRHVDLIVDSIARNGGRACLNASGVWTTAHGRELAEELARRMAAMEARALDDPEATLAAFSNPVFAERIDAMIEQHLRVEGAEDLTARHRPGGRLVQRDGLTYLLPTLIWCEDRTHPLAACEFLFPFATVVEVPQAELVESLGDTLVCTALTDDPKLRGELLAARHVDRLNFGPYPTPQLSWDQPHEGNLFEHLYRQRSLQTGAASAA